MELLYLVGAGLQHVDQATLDADEKAILAELQDPSHLYRILVFSKKTNGDRYHMIKD